MESHSCRHKACPWFSNTLQGLRTHVCNAHLNIYINASFLQERKSPKFYSISPTQGRRFGKINIIKDDRVDQSEHWGDSFSNIGKGESDLIFLCVSEFSLLPLNETRETFTASDEFVTVLIHLSNKWSERFCDFILKAFIENISNYSFFWKRIQLSERWNYLLPLV